MAVKDPERLKPATDLLMQSSQQVASDRARRINSLHKQVNGLLQDETKKTRQIGGEVGSIVQQQQALRKELQLARDEITTDVASGYGKVVNNLGNTIKQMSIGMKNISVSTARASADAISQYGKAIGQDIHINKTNTIAMALSRATPIFGYFAAKFMETDVFRGAVSKIRQGVGAAMLAGLRGAGSSISNIFRGKSTTAEKISGRERELGALSSEVASLKKELQAKPPRLQSGGYVKKGGVVEVHAAEIVAPVDKLVKQIVETTNQQQQGFLKTFLKEFRSAKNPKEEAWQDRMLKSIIELKVAFIGTTSRLRIAWQKTLLENPAFRGMLMFAEGFKAVLGAPINWFFGARGGYLSDVKKATATDNVFLKVANVLGLIYTVGMPKLDAIAKYTRVSATVAAGYEPKAPQQDKYTMFQKVRAFVTKKKSGPSELKETGVAKFWEMMGVDEETLKEFKEEGGFRSLFGLGKQAAEEGFEGAKDLGGKGKQAAEEGFDVIKEQALGIWELVKLKRKQEDRERPKSPSWVQYLGMTFGKVKESAKLGFKRTKTSVDSYIEAKKSRKIQQRQLGFLGRMSKRLKRLGRWGWKLLMFGFSMFQGIIGMGVSMIGSLLSPLLAALGLSGLFTGGKGKLGFVDTAKKGIKKGGEFAKNTGRVGRMAGGAAAGKYALKGVGRTAGNIGMGALKTGGRLLGGAAGGIFGAASGLWDAGSAIAGGKSQGYEGGALIRGASGFLGGTETGTSGAISGAMKWGGIGAMAGSFVPGIGTAIGGVIGAISGGIMGAVGGKNISKGMAWLKGGTKKTVEGVEKTMKVVPDAVDEQTKILSEAAEKGKQDANSKIAEIASFWGFDVKDSPLFGTKKGGGVSGGWGKGEGGVKPGDTKFAIEGFDYFSSNRTRIGAGLTPEQIKSFHNKGGHDVLGMLNASAGKWDKTGKLVQAEIGGKWYNIKLRETGQLKEMRQASFHEKILGIPLNKEMSEREAARQRAQNMTEQLSGKMDETTDKSNKIAIGNTSVLTSNISNTSNSATGGRGGGGASGSWWGSGDSASRDVTYSSLN